VVDLKEVRGGFVYRKGKEKFFIPHRLVDVAECRRFVDGRFKSRDPVLYVGDGWIARVDVAPGGDCYLNVRFINPFFPVSMRRDFNYPSRDFVKLLSKFVKLHDFKNGRVL